MESSLKKPGPYTVNLAADGTEDLTNVLANKLLVDNRRFIQEETLAFIENEINDGDNTDDFADTFTFNRDKCFRDLGLIIDAVSFDLTYVGNSKTVDAALSYWDGATSRVAGQQSETVAAINFAKNLITTNVLTNTAYVAPSNTRNPYAHDLITKNLGKIEALSNAINSIQGESFDEFTKSIEANTNLINSNFDRNRAYMNDKFTENSNVIFNGLSPSNLKSKLESVEGMALKNATVDKLTITGTGSDALMVNGVSIPDEWKTMSDKYDNLRANYDNIVGFNPQG